VTASRRLQFATRSSNVIGGNHRAAPASARGTGRTAYTKDVRRTKFRGCAIGEQDPNYAHMVPPLWTTLRSIGESRVLRSSYFWIVFVPVVVKALRLVEPLVSIVVAGQTWKLDLSLPFRWTAFFYSALFAALGHALYVWRCPQIVRQYDSFTAFAAGGRGPEHVRKEFLLLLSRYHKAVASDDLAKTVAQYRADFSQRPLSSEETVAIAENSWRAVNAVSDGALNPGTAPEAFAFVRDLADEMAPRSHAVVFGAYIVALSLIAVVLGQNVWFVVQYTWSDWSEYARSFVKGLG
jgi:hypothetical protein